LPAHTVLLAVAYVLVFAFVAAVLPCWEVSKLRVSDALRRL
jgi:ABC-type lipoprotein release transport system permease subunit